MSEIQPYQGAMQLSPRDNRRVGRAVSKYSAHTQVVVASVDASTDGMLAKMDSVNEVTARAMGSVARVAQLQNQLETQVPQSAGRLNMIAEAHAMDMLEVTQAHRYNMRLR